MYIVHDQEPPPSHAKFLIHLKVFLTPSKDCQFRRNFVCPNSELLNFSAGAAHNHRMAGSMESLVVFQPFFASARLPYSVIRNERVPLKIQVFNYLEECIAVKLKIIKYRSIMKVIGNCDVVYVLVLLHAICLCVCGTEFASVCLSVCLSVYMYVPLYFHMSVCPSVSLSL